MNYYLINLAGRTDRLHFMSDQFESMGHAFIRVDAISPDSLQDHDSLFALLRQRGLGKGEACCALSHYTTWNLFLESGDATCVVLARISHSAPTTFADQAW